MGLVPARTEEAAQTEGGVERGDSVNEGTAREETAWTVQEKTRGEDEGRGERRYEQKYPKEHNKINCLSNFVANNDVQQK